MVEPNIKYWIHFFINGMFEFKINKNTKSWNWIWNQNSYNRIPGKSGEPILESRDLWSRETLEPSLSLEWA